MAGSVHIPWYATGFRGDKLAAALAEIAPVALRYGASSYAVYRANDDLYKFLQTASFENKADWDGYWNGPEFTRFRTLAVSWYQVPVLYAWHDVVAEGAMPQVVDVANAQAQA
jgi:quinol monooxygenase YgiN